MFKRLIHLLESLKTPCCRVISVHPDAKVPVKGSEDAAGYDLYSVDEIVLNPFERALVHTGLLVAPPPGCHIEIRPRSGLALKNGITVLNTPGTIDADYRGEIMVILINTSQTAFEVHKGDRIAQAVVMRHETPIWVTVSSFDNTSRGSNGFGSSGIH